VFQVHYTPNGTPQKDLTRIGLVFADPATITHEIQTHSTRTRQIRLEPFQDDQKVTCAPMTAPLDLQLLSFSPHMHLRGKSFRYELTWPDGRTETLLDVPHYDFNWQTSYRLQQPLDIPKGSKLVAYASFDNSRNNLANPDPSAVVTWGDQSWEEMCIGYFDIAIPKGHDVSRRELLQDQARGAAAKAVFDRLDVNKDGGLSRDEIPERFRSRFGELDGDQSGSLSLPELQAGLSRLRDR
jgi:hypothetical protein